MEELKTQLSSLMVVSKNPVVFIVVDGATDHSVVLIVDGEVVHCLALAQSSTLVDIAMSISRHTCAAHSRAQNSAQSRTQNRTEGRDRSRAWISPRNHARTSA